MSEHVDPGHDGYDRDGGDYHGEHGNDDDRDDNVLVYQVGEATVTACSGDVSGLVGELYEFAKNVLVRSRQGYTRLASEREMSNRP